MNTYRPLRAVLFFYELLRLFLLAIFFAVFSPFEGAVKGRVFPYLAFVTPNALFPLITLFMWLKLEDYRNYLSLYSAGKVIGVAAFYAWGIFSLRAGPGPESLGISSQLEVIVLLGGSFFLNLGDILAVLGSRVLAKKISKTEKEHAGLLTGNDGGV
jgi:hypothetical protein